jgi:hypothetical protein
LAILDLAGVVLHSFGSDIGMMADQRRSDVSEGWATIVIHSDPSDTERHRDLWVDGQNQREAVCQDRLETLEACPTVYWGNS